MKNYNFFGAKIAKSTFFSVTSDTSWGQTMSLSDLNEVSNFSWRCQLSYETIFLWSVPKLECPETDISQWALLAPSPPRLLNWPKSPHRLGLKFSHFVCCIIAKKSIQILKYVLLLSFLLVTINMEWLLYTNTEKYMIFKYFFRFQGFLNPCFEQVTKLWRPKE